MDISIVASTSPGKPTMATTWSATSLGTRRPSAPGLRGSKIRVSALTHSARPEPARHRLADDPERHRVGAAEASLPAPVLAGVARRPCVPAHPNRLQPADRAVAQHSNDRAVGPERERRRHDHRHLARVRQRRLEHLARRSGVGRHPCFRQDVLAGLERRDRDRGVEVRPGADEDRIEVRVLHERTPVGDGARDAQLRRHAARRGQGLVRHDGDLDALDRPEPRNVLGAHDLAGPGNADPQHLGHDDAPRVDVASGRRPRRAPRSRVYRPVTGAWWAQ